MASQSYEYQNIFETIELRNMKSGIEYFMVVN